MSGPTDEPEPFTAPKTYHTPKAVRAAGQRLYVWAASHQVDDSVPLLELEIPGVEWQAARDQALISWFVSQLPS